MRRLLGFLLLLTVLGASAACGSSDTGSATTADDPAPTSASTSATSAPTSVPTTSTPSSDPSDPSDPSSPAGGAGGDAVEFTEVGLVSQPGAGNGSAGKPGLATVLDTPAAVGPFADQFQQGALTSDLMSAIDAADVPEGQVLVGAVVSVGCDVPPGIASVTRTGQGLVLTAAKVADPLQECFAAVTTVGLVLVDASLV